MTSRAEPLTLASRRSYWRFAQVERPGEPIVPLPERWTRDRLGTAVEVAGFWDHVGRLRAAVYAHGGELLAQLGRQVIRLDPALSVRHSQGRVVRRLAIGPPTAPLFASSYLRPFGSVFHVFDPWATEGDYDFGAFIAEIAARASLRDDPLPGIWPFEQELHREAGERVLR